MQQRAALPPDSRIVELLKTEFATLCNTCDHFNACSYQDDEKGVLQCELFESTSEGVAHLGRLEILKEEVITPVSTKGICVNCEKVWTCKLPKGLAGVWHCEEYE
ncbi:MAG: hypothetical protein AB7K37_09575 [Cyclobacteriaceae bacterium]